MDGHLLTLSEVELVSSQLVSHLLDTEASPEESACLSVLGEDQVVVFERGGSTNAGSLLTELGHVEGDSALALGCVVYLIGLIHGDHGIVHLQDVLVLKSFSVSRCHDVTLGVNNAETLHFFKRVSERHLVSE